MGLACDMILVTKPPREVGFCDRVVTAQAILDASTVWLWPAEHADDSVNVLALVASESSAQ